MSVEQKGSCHCKSCHYTITGEKQFEFLCHCTDCKIINSGGHLSGMVVKKEGFSIEGDLSQYSYMGGSEKPINYFFCKKCGTGLYASIETHPDVAVVRANTLADPTFFNPQKSLFPKSAFSWDKSIIPDS